MTTSARTKIVWPEDGRPHCTRCLGDVVVYIVFMDDEPKVLGTRCSLCDPYRDNKEHFKSWKHKIPFRLHGHVQIRVPLDETAWSFAKSFMDAPGTRMTRPSPASWR